MIVRRVDLGPRGIAYVERQLVQRGALAQMLGRQLELAAGYAFTYPVATVPDDKLFNFDSGAGGDKGTCSVVQPQVVAYLASRDDAFVVMEDDVADPGDQWLGTQPMAPLFFYPGTRLSTNPETGETNHYGDVYRYFTHDDAQPQGVDAVMGPSSGYFFTAILTLRQRNGSIPHFERLSLSYLESLVAATRAIILDVYDAEGYLVWVPGTRELNEWPREGGVRD